MRNPSLKRVFWMAAILVFTAAPGHSQSHETPAPIDEQGCLTLSTPYDDNPALQDALLLKNTWIKPDPSPLEKIFWKARRIVYVDDRSQDRWQAPLVTGSRMAGDCEDKALWLYSQLKVNGYSNVRLVIGRHRLHDATTHAWVMYTDDKAETLILDPTQNNRIWPVTKFMSGFYQPLYSFDGLLRYKHLDQAASAAETGCIDYPTEAIARFSRYRFAAFILFLRLLPVGIFAL